MQTIFLKEEECYCQLDKFYANVAKHLGYDVPYGDEKHTFDCRKICITPSAYQKIKEIFRRECTSLLFYAKMSLHCETQCGGNCLCVSGNKKYLLIMA